MDGLGEQGLARASLAEQYNWNVGLRGECCQLQTPRHGLIGCGQVLNSQSGKWLLHRELKCLLLHAFTQLANWFERVFDQRPSADNDVRISSHSDSQRQGLSCPCRDFIAVE